jgi:hypothetical protein
MSTRMGIGSWITLIVLVSLLVATVVVDNIGLPQGSGADMPASGYATMTLGVIISLAVGFGLMGLIFYSSRKGYDEPPVLISTDDDNLDAKEVAAGATMDATAAMATPAAAAGAVKGTMTNGTVGKNSEKPS